MAVTYTWTIPTVERTTATGGIDTIHWRCSASETVGTGDDAVTHTASSYGTVGCTPDPSASDFIAFADLTQANVLAWVWNTVVKADVETAIADKINAELNPTTTAGVPW